MTDLKWQCNECGYFVDGKDRLEIANPFNAAENIHGCPLCYSVNSFKNICDETDCEEEATCGWPSAEGYRRTCELHMKKDSE